MRRWGIFWGVVSPHEWEDTETVFNRVGAWLTRPRVKRTVFAIAAIEFAALGSWVYVAHGTHLYQLGDQTLGRMQGQTIVYSGICGKNGEDRMVRIVLSQPRRAQVGEL